MINVYRVGDRPLYFLASRLLVDDKQLVLKSTPVYRPAVVLESLGFGLYTVLIYTVDDDRDLRAMDGGLVIGEHESPHFIQRRLCQIGTTEGNILPPE